MARNNISMANGKSKSPTNAQPTKPMAPKSQTMGLLIALSILMMVGFLVLYFKIDLDSQLAANNTALLSQQVQQLDMRVGKMDAPTAMPEQVMPSNEHTMTSSTGMKGYSWKTLTFELPANMNVTANSENEFTAETNGPANLCGADVPRGAQTPLGPVNCTEGYRFTLTPFKKGYFEGNEPTLVDTALSDVQKGTGEYDGWYLIKRDPNNWYYLTFQSSDPTLGSFFDSLKAH